MYMEFASPRVSMPHMERVFIVQRLLSPLPEAATERLQQMQLDLGLTSGMGEPDVARSGLVCHLCTVLDV